MAGVAEVGHTSIDSFGSQSTGDAYFGRAEFQATAPGHLSNGSEQRNQVYSKQVNRNEKTDTIVYSDTAQSSDTTEFGDAQKRSEIYPEFSPVSSFNHIKAVVEIPGVSSPSSATVDSGKSIANGNSNNNSQRKSPHSRVSPKRPVGFQKPPILSPKPFISKKPRRLSEVIDSSKGSPTARNELDNENIFQFGNSAIRRVSAPSVAYKAKLTSKKVVTPEYILQSTETSEKSKDYTCDGGISTTPKACLPRILCARADYNSASENTRSIPDNINRSHLTGQIQSSGSNMDFKSKQQLISNILPDPARIPPKVACKPKNRPPALHLSAAANQFKNESRTDELAVAPVSEKRNRFEQMKMTFKKPVPDPVFKPPQTEKNRRSNGPLSPTANELFKDILEMKDIHSFDENTTIQTPLEDAIGSDIPSELSSDIPMTNVAWSFQDNDSKNISVGSTIHMGDLKNKYEHEFESKLINSLISPTEKKNFFNVTESKVEGYTQSPILGEPKRNTLPRKLSDHSITQIPRKFEDQPGNQQSKKQTQILDSDFEFPPPPTDFPSPPEQPQLDRSNNSHSVEAEAPRFPLFSVAGEASYTEQRSSNPPSRHVTTGPVDAQSTLSKYSIGESERVVSKCAEMSSQSSVATDSNVKQTTGGKRSPDIAKTYQQKHIISFNKDKRRDIDDEILYYDNMDIMEKVRHKREQDERRMAKVIARESAQNPEIPAQSNEGISCSSNEQKNTSSQDRRVERVSVDSNRKTQIRQVLRPCPEDRRSNQSTEQTDANANNLTEFRSALGELEYEYKKLKENLDQQMDTVGAATPPKLPPKQKKLVRKPVDVQQLSQTNGTSTQSKSQTHQQNRQLKLHIPGPNQQVSQPAHVPSPMPQFYQAQANFSRPVTQQSPVLPINVPVQNIQQSKTSGVKVLSTSDHQNLPSALLHQNVLSQLSVDETRARSIVDEPLAPIIEEDSTYGDSSSCASSVTGDDLSIYTDDCSIHTRQQSGSPSWSVASSRGLHAFEGDEDVTETEEDTTNRESGSTTVHSTSSADDTSDTSSVRWQNNPMIRTSRQSSSEMPMLKQKETQRGSKSNQIDRDEDYELISDSEEKNSHSGSVGFERAVSVESKVSVSSAGTTSLGRSGEAAKTENPDTDLVHDVEPYGMVDLTNFEPSFEAVTPVQSRKFQPPKDEELTPSSIMHSVNEFFGTLPRNKQKQVESGSPTEEDTPHFPLDIPPNQAPPTPKYSRSSKSASVTPQRHYRSKSDAERELKVPVGYEEVGYDNLENYGGETRKAAEAKKAKFRQDKPTKTEKKSVEYNRNRSFDSTEEDTSRSRDSLASTPGLSQQTAGSRASFPLPVSASRLARHSSAVSALDRHSGNLKRSKQSNTTSVKSPSSRRIEQRGKQQSELQASTLPRLRSNDYDNKSNKSKLDHPSKSTEHIETVSEGERNQTRKVHNNQEALIARERQIARESLAKRTPSRESAVERQCSQEKDFHSINENVQFGRQYSGEKQYNESYNRSQVIGIPTTPEAKPFPTYNLDYDERMDDGIVNPYEEVPFVLNGSQNNSIVYKAKVETEEQAEAKHRVQEILDNIQPPESPYKPKPPIPRYPVEYDNFYLENTGEAKSQASSGIGTDEAGRSKIGSASGATSSSSPPPSPSVEEPTKPSGFSEGGITPVSSPASVRSSRVAIDSGTDATLPFDEFEEAQLTNQTRRKSGEEGRTGDDSSDTASTTNRSLGSQLRSLLGGSPESKYISPSLRRKRSLLKRSKSPGGSRRARTPPRSKSPNKEEEKQSELDSIASTPALPRKEESSKRSSKIERRSSGVSTKSEALVSGIREVSISSKPKERSASQRIVDRRGRAGSSSNSKSKASDTEDEPTDLTKGRKSRMSSRWRRSKSTDRSPTRSKSKDRAKFDKRSKSQERPPPKGLETREIDIEDGEERGGRSFFRRNRSSSRKREKRGKSSERKEDGGTRGRNPVKFFRKLLRNKKDDEEIVHVPLGKGVDMSQSTEALSIILAYKGDEVSEPEQWTPPRPHPPQQRVTKSKQNASPVKPKEKKAMRSPPSHRAKKITSAALTKNQAELSAESSSEGIGSGSKTKLATRSDTYGNLGSNRVNLGAPQKPARPSSRKSSFSNSLPSSDSERQIKPEVKSSNGAGVKADLRSSRLQQIQKGAPLLRRNLLQREYDSDTPTSALASDADSSAGIASDAENGDQIRSAIKKGPLAKLKGTWRGAPRRPVRVISPRRSQSDPSIFDSDTPALNKNIYYNLEVEEKPKSPSIAQEKKRSSKLAQQRRRNQKQNRRQTAPVDLAYATHQRQKYRTLVSLNAQTLRKVTERWLAEWRNQLPVGGFLITSWSDVAIESHRPICMIGNSVVYPAVSAGNNKFKLACQLYDQRDVGDRMLQKLESSSSLPAHPNTCGVCSHFPCRVPRSLLDPTSGGGAADALCVVLSSRPSHSLQEYLDRLVSQEEPTEYHRQILVALLQLLHGIKHLLTSGFDMPYISAEHLVITEDRGFLQILPHLNWSETEELTKRNRWDVEKVLDAYQSSDSDSNQNTHSLSRTQQLAGLVKRLLQNANLASSAAGMGRPGDRNSAASLVSRVVVPGTKYSTAIKHIVHYLERSPPVGTQEAAELVQCALWGPEDLEDVGVDDVSPYAALELWIEMEQAKLVNSLAVLTPGDRMVPVSYLKHQYFSSVTPEVLFNGLKILQRI